MHQTYLDHLQKIVQIPTVSSADDAQTDWEPFRRLHAFLEEAYPLIHSRMEKITIGHASLLFHWKSEHPKYAPVLLMAHQDVVPAGPLDQWTYDPYSAAIADGCLWGRGSNDIKCMVIAECEAVEGLLSEGFDPDFDIYLAFGHNEEVRCSDDKKGSALTAAYLKERGVHLGCIFDEGGKVKKGSDFGYTKDAAFVYMTEKAPTQFLLYKNGTGGHGSMPGKGTVLGSVARGMVAVEDHPFPYRFSETGRLEIEGLSKILTGRKQEVFAHPIAHWTELSHIAREDRFLDAVLHTTMAVNMASGSPQSNVLPAHAEALINIRILQGDTMASVKSYLEKIMPDGVQVKIVSGQDPIPEAKAEGMEFETLTKAVRDVYGADVPVIPSIMPGATDSRKYIDICDHIFRFSGCIETKAWGEAHQVDERVPVDVEEAPVAFFQSFLRKYGK